MEKIIWKNGRPGAEIRSAVFLSRKLSSVLLGGKSGIFFKYLCEIALIFKADIDGDIQDRTVRTGQKLLAFFNADII